MSRVDKVAKNMRIALICQALTALESFVLRSFFVSCLDEVYLGLNGLFSDILSMLSLAELGFGTSIIFSLYKPVANSDTEKIKSLMRLYKKIYSMVGAFVLIAGLALAPRLDLFLKEVPDIPHLRLIYALSVVNSATSYFFVYKASLLFADQKKYVELIINTAVKFIGVIAQIVVLVFTHSYIALMAATIATTLAQNICIALSTDKRYPYLREKNIQPLAKEDTRVLKNNVGAMVFHKFGSVAVFSTDSILMAKLVSVASVGLYSNYMLIRKAIIMVVEVMFNAITSGMGNLSACEGGDRRREAFENVYFFSAWLFGFASICLAELYNPFITLWLGERFLFGRGVVLLIVLYFYLYCMRIPVCSAKEAMGLFSQDKYKPIFEVVLNLVISIVLAKKIGIAGVILGTILSTLLVPFWIEPLVVYKCGFKARLAEFFARFGIYTLVTLAVWQLTALLCGLTPDGLWGFIMKMAICIIVPNAAFAAVYCRTKEFAYLKNVGFSLLAKLKRKK